MKLIPSIYTLGLVLSLSSMLAFADAGHDEVAPTQSAEIAPRIVTNSELFELVGVVEDGTMTIYLDRYADNSPVTNANIEVEIGTEQGMAKANANGTYSFAAKAFTTSAEVPVTFTISAGEESDLLSADLIMADTHMEVTHDTASPFTNKWLIGFLVLVIALIVWFVTRRRRQQLNLFKGTLK